MTKLRTLILIVVTMAAFSWSGSVMAEDADWYPAKQGTLWTYTGKSSTGGVAGKGVVKFRMLTGDEEVTFELAGVDEAKP